ncbi:MAG: hypothetical protein EXR58_03630 [Chloroflexi bacterium]|nr:hypothetical protein [Chloroflexota bacterium]
MRLRIDPWATDYGAAVQTEDEVESQPDVDVTVEMAPTEWRPITPNPLPRPRSIAFVDGTQRLEAHVTLEEEGETFFGVMATLAIGAVRAEHTAMTFEEPLVHRTLALGDGQRLFAALGGAAVEPLTIHGGSQDLKFIPRPSKKPALEGVRDAIDSQRRDLETQFGQRLIARGEPLVVMDGPLRLFPTPHTDLVGYMKTIHRRYLPPECAPILPQLRARERSPLFLILGRTSRYSWYLRLTNPRAIDHSLAGVVRLETVAEIGIERAKELADQTTLYLPDFASPRERDPRAPQNLLPIGGLETRLRHEMGDPAWVRRAIEQYLFQQAAS